MICDYSEGMCPYLPVALSIRCDECMVKKAYKHGFYERRQHGEWIKKCNADDPTTACSVCGFDTEDKVYFNFCPNCGADMRKEGDKE